MIVEPTAIPGVLLITPPRFLDDRGLLLGDLERAPLRRGRHPRAVRAGQPRALGRARRGARPALQIAPNAQGKLVRVVRGSIWDVAVDIRPGSPTYGRHAGVVLSAENWQQLWVPRDCCTATARSSRTPR